jgi:hypothetical protein
MEMGLAAFEDEGRDSAAAARELALARSLFVESGALPRAQRAAAHLAQLDRA